MFFKILTGTKLYARIGFERTHFVFKKLCLKNIPRE